MRLEGVFDQQQKPRKPLQIKEALSACTTTTCPAKHYGQQKRKGPRSAPTSIKSHPYNNKPERAQHRNKTKHFPVSLVALGSVQFCLLLAYFISVVSFRTTAAAQQMFIDHASS
jgi:hypothetical protein